MSRASVLGVIGREFKRVVRNPARLASTFARPLIWLIIIGSGFSALIPGGQFSYHKYLLPGIIGMVVLFSALLTALGSVHDRQFGSMRMLLIAPVPRGVIVLSKALSSTLVSAVFAIVLSPLAWLFDIHMSALDYLAFIGAVLLCSLALSSLGMLVASRIRRLENFAVAMNFVIFPMFFLSGALYPTGRLPGYLKPLVRINPLTYGVDLMRHEMLAGVPGAVSRVAYAPRLDVAFLVIFSLVALALAASLFGGEERMAATLLGSAPGRRAGAPPARTAQRQPAAPTSRPSETAPSHGRAGGLFGAGAALAGLSGIVTREFKRALRQPGRLASTFARPLLWLLAAGSGFAALVPGGDYKTYLLPGVIGMVVLFSCLLSALGSVHDHQFGPMRMLLIAPVPRAMIVLGKTISSALLGAAFAVLMSALAWAFGVDPRLIDYLEFVGAVLLCAVAMSSLGMLAASRISRLEDFAVAMNFVIFPMFFLSGALYPARKLPGFMQPLVRINPLTYGVDLMRQTLLAGQTGVLRAAEFAPRLDIVYLVAFSIVTFALAARLFGGERHLAPMFLSGGQRRMPPQPPLAGGGPSEQQPVLVHS